MTLRKQFLLRQVALLVGDQDTILLEWLKAFTTPDIAKKNKTKANLPPVYRKWEIVGHAPYIYYQ